MGLSAKKFENLKQRLSALLTPQGYEVVRCELDGPFGSHLAQFKRNASAFDAMIAEVEKGTHAPGHRVRDEP